jgi:RNA polymerase sigma factor (TIGR02999 family)
MPDEDVTQLLAAVREQQRGASDELLAVVYEQLRRIAEHRMRGERSDHTLQATALVHEAYVRLLGDEPIAWDSRAHFFSAAAEAMRRILIEHARARGRKKRGGDVEGRPRKRIPLDVVDLASNADPDEILSVDDAVCRLESQDPQLGRIVRLRFYAGLSEQEIADALGVSERTIRREWVLARAWLGARLSEARTL